MDIEYAAERIGRPVSTWAGDCHGIATLIAKALTEDGVLSSSGEARVARGHWIGPVHPGSYFGLRAGSAFIGHSWIVTDAGLLIDPTRFAFEAPETEPYIYIGKATEQEYDEGGNVWRAAQMRPAPSYSPSDAILGLPLNGRAGYWVAEQTGFQYAPGVVTWPLAMWLANLPVPVLGAHAVAIFEYLEKAGKSALIPIDNRRMVLGR